MIRSLSIDKVVTDAIRQDGGDPFMVVDEALRGDGRFSLGLGPSAHIPKVSVNPGAPRMDGAVVVSGSHAYFSRMMVRLAHGDDVRLLYTQANSLHDQDPIRDEDQATLEIRHSNLDLGHLPRQGSKLHDFLRIPVLKRAGRVLDCWPMEGKAETESSVGYRSNIYVLVEPAWEQLMR